MRQINLATQDASRAKLQKKGGIKSLVFGMILLLISIGAYAGMYFYYQKVESDITNLEVEIANNKLSLDKEANKELYNFESRLETVGKQLEDSSAKSKILDVLSQATYPDTTFNSIGNSESTVDSESESKYEIEIFTPDYDALARQINAFDSSSYVENVYLQNSLQEENGLKSSIQITFKTDTIVKQGKN